MLFSQKCKANLSLCMSNTFCPLPWNFQAVRNNGDYRICCQANVSSDRGILRHDDGRVANAATDDPIEVRNLPLMRDARVKMLAGEWPASCTRCEKEEASGLRSRRIYENQMWSGLVNPLSVAAVTAADGRIDARDVHVRSLDIRFGNKCNLIPIVFRESTCRIKIMSSGSRKPTENVNLTYFFGDRFHVFVRIGATASIIAIKTWI